MNLSRRRSSSGDSLIEIIIVTFVVATMLVSLASLTTIAVARNRLASQRVAANRLAQEGLEWLRAQRDIGFDEFEQVVHGCGSTCYACIGELLPTATINDLDVRDSQYTCSEKINGLYSRSATFTGNTGLVSVSVSISWPGQSTTQQIQLDGELTKWQK